jgi:hypothetical protein
MFVVTGMTLPKQRVMPMKMTTRKSLLSLVCLPPPVPTPPSRLTLTHPIAPSASKKRKTTKDAAPAAEDDDEDDEDEEPAGEDDDEVDPADLDDEEEAADVDDEDAGEDVDDTADKSGPAAAAKKAKERNVPGGKDKAEVGDIGNADEKDGGL